MRTGLGIAVLTISLLAGCTDDMPPPTFTPAPSEPPAASPSPSPTPPKPAPTTVLEKGEGTFSQTAPGGTEVFGTAGSLREYCVQVEDGITTFTVEEFAAVVDEVLGDSRSWIAAKKWRFQRVPSCDGADLRVRLTTPKTTNRLCASAGVNPMGKYSCRNRNDLFINLRRWTLGVPHFEGDLERYRTMLINHETGHYLGHGHRNCPGKGKPAPVMQQQTISLKGCVINPYPYPDGENYVR